MIWQRNAENRSGKLLRWKRGRWHYDHFWYWTETWDYFTVPYKTQILTWWLLLQILVLWLAEKKKQTNKQKKTHTQELNAFIIMQRKGRNISLCWSLTYIFEFENVSSPFSFRWHLLLRCGSFIFGASQPCGPPVDLLLGLKSRTTHIRYSAADQQTLHNCIH